MYVKVIDWTERKEINKSIRHLWELLLQIDIKLKAFHFPLTGISFTSDLYRNRSAVQLQL